MNVFLEILEKAYMKVLTGDNFTLLTHLRFNNKMNIHEVMKTRLTNNLIKDR